MTMYADATKASREHAKNSNLIAAERAAERAKNAADRAVAAERAAAVDVHEANEFAEYLEAVADATRATEYAAASRIRLMAAARAPSSAPRASR